MEKLAFNASINSQLTSIFQLVSLQEVDARANSAGIESLPLAYPLTVLGGCEDSVVIFKPHRCNGLDGVAFIGLCNRYVDLWRADREYPSSLTKRSLPSQPVTSCIKKRVQQTFKGVEAKLEPQILKGVLPVESLGTKIAVQFVCLLVPLAQICNVS